MYVMENVQRSLAAFAALAALAGRQYGHVTLAQLRALGFSRGAIEHMCRTGRLIRVHQGVYAVGHRRLDPPARIAAAVLAGGPNALASHSSAAFLWGMVKRWKGPVDVCGPRTRRPTGIRTHTCTALTPRDIRTHLGIRLTSPARTLLDITPGMTDAQLARAAREARLNRYLRLPDLRELLTRQPRHPGATRLKGLAATTTGPTRSDFEDLFLEFVRRFNLPIPLVNTKVAGYEVDILFGAEKVVIELDSYEFHRDRRSFMRDREKGAALAAEGFLTVYETWDRIIGAGADREAARLHKTLAQRRQR
jgi:very-short-patch-repair endonuclease